MAHVLSTGPGLDTLDLARASARWNLAPPRLYEEAIRRGEGALTVDGALACVTGAHTGRSPLDKFIVRERSSEAQLWWGDVNRPLSEDHFDALERDLAAYLGRRDLFVQDVAAGADERYRLHVRVIAERAWHTVFASRLLRPLDDEAAESAPDLTVVCAPGFTAEPARHGTRSEVCVAVHLGRGLVLIGGTAYAGEIKKAVFSVLNYVLPGRGVLPMHCAANRGRDGRVALFFGLSGTGKTTLSSDGERSLIGDDEHGWSDEGVFNFEGGCYAKLIGLSAAAEPHIASAVNRFGSVIENVVIDPVTRIPDYTAASITENTRGAYPLGAIATHAAPFGPHPSDIVMLTADAFGVLPPIARLTVPQALYHFLSGYTARVAGTERGVTTPTATFSACFGAPFLPRRPAVYAHLFGQKLARHRPRVWLVNTGWTGGPAGVGSRVPLASTRAMVHAALSGALDEVPIQMHTVLGFSVPAFCPGVPSELLRPRDTWTDGAAYDAQARTLCAMFDANFSEWAGDVSPEVRRAGPRRD